MKNAILITLSLFTAYNTRKFNARAKYYVDKGEQEVSDFWDFAANAIARAYATGNVDMLNMAVTASLAVGRYRSFARCVPGCVPWAWDKKERVFHGAKQKAKAAKLTAIAEDGVVVWETTLAEYIATEAEHETKTPASSWDEDVKLYAFTLDMIRHNKTGDHIKERVEKAAAMTEEELASALKQARKAA